MSGDDDQYILRVSTTLMSVLKANSVGRKLVLMITERIMEMGSAISTADPDLPVARTKDTWMRFAEAWKARATEDGVATIVLGHDGNDRLRSIVVGDIHGHLMAVPVMLFDSGNDVDVPLPPPGTPQWILACLPQLTHVMNNRRIVKVIAQADKAKDLVSDGRPFPVLDPVVVAERMAPEKFDYWVNRDKTSSDKTVKRQDGQDDKTVKRQDGQDDMREVETTRFGIKLAVHYFCGQQDGPYLPDEYPEKKERQQKRMEEWPGEGGSGDYTIAQKRWTLQMSLTSILSVLGMAEMFMMPSVMNMNEDRMGEALAIVMRNMGFAVHSDVEYWGRSPTLDCSGTIRRNRRAGVQRTDWRDDSHDTHPGRIIFRANSDEDDDDDESCTTAVGEPKNQDLH